MKRLVRIVTATAAGFLILGAFATGASADTNKQAAINYANNNQEAIAVSGDAHAVFGVAKSGDATAANASIQKQDIEQNAANVSFGCKCHGHDSNLQLGANVANNNQGAAAASGNAAAFFGWASSGDATAVNLSAQKQEIEQNALNLSIDGKKKHHR